MVAIGNDSRLATVARGELFVVKENITAKGASMATITILVICVISILIISYTTGNKQANELMVTLGGDLENIQKWNNYSLLLNVILFGLIPLSLALYGLGWIGLIYAPLALLIPIKTSYLFLKSQLQKRLVNKELQLTKTLENNRIHNMSSIQKIEMHQHSVNELRWLISHPKSAQHLAVSDEGKLNPQIVEAFKFQVNALDKMSKQELEGSK